MYSSYIHCREVLCYEQFGTIARRFGKENGGVIR